MTRGILYLSKTGCDIFVPALPSVVHVAFPQTSVRDMDVLNIDELSTAIRTAFEQNKIVPPITFSLILSKSVLFIKEFPRFDTKAPSPKAPPATDSPQTTPTLPPPQMTAVERDQAIADQDDAIQSFIEHVPFEEVTSKVLVMPAAKVVVATNSELFKGVKETVIKMGNSVDLVLPETLLTTIQFGPQLTPVIAQNILGHEDTYKQHNFLSIPVVVLEQSTSRVKKTAKPSNKRAIALGGVFLVLIIVMIVMYYTTYMVPTPKKKSAVQTAPVAKTSVVPTAIISPAQSASVSANISSLQVQLTTDARSASFAATLKKGLTTIGLTDVTVNQSTANSGRSLIIYAPTVPTDVREKILSLVKGIDPTVTTQENSSAVTPIFISVGSH